MEKRSGTVLALLCVDEFYEAHRTMTQRILLLSDNPAHSACFKQTLADGDQCFEDDDPKSINLRNAINNTAADLVVIILKDVCEKTEELIFNHLKSHPIPIIMFIENTDYIKAATATQAGVSAYVVDGFREDRVKPILSTAVTRFKATQELQNQLSDVQNELKERKLIERAKGLLMKQRHYTEDEAYNALRKLSMKTNKRLGEISASIIDASMLLN